MSDPWLTPDSASLVERFVASHRQLTGRDIPGLSSHESDLAAKAYNAPIVLLAHDGAADPRFTYANRQAQALWEMPWERFVGMPSRLSAEPEAVADRQRLLDRARERGFIDDYNGIRRSSTGKRFRIQDVTLWNILDAGGQRIGQAAWFATWTPI